MNAEGEVVEFGGFDAAWPTARAQLAAVLGARGVQPADVDDITQEVAFRALRIPRPFDCDDHFVAWCCRVAINLHIDATRRERRVSGEPVPEAVTVHDTAATAERRMALETLASEIAGLSHEERRLLFDNEGAASRKEAVRLAVRRHRLRARLAAVVEGMAALIFFMRRLTRFARRLPTAAKVSLAASPIVAVGLVLVPFTDGRQYAPVRLPSRQEPVVTGIPTSAPGRSSVPAPRTASAPLPTARAAATVPAPPTSITAKPPIGVRAAPAGVPVAVTTVQRPDNAPLVCTGGLAGACVQRPPGFASHSLPLP